MKKYILFPDVTDKSAAHIVEMPSNVFFKVKTCEDGIAIAIGNKDNDEIYGLMVGCDESFLPLMKRVAASDKAKELEESTLLKLEIAFLEFLNDKDTGLLELDNELEDYVEDLNIALYHMQNETKYEEREEIQKAMEAKQARRHNH